MEEYKGVKFQVIDLEGEVPHKEKLLTLDKLLSKYLQPVENEGNMSVREGKGFLIKKAGCKMTQLKDDEVIFVEKVVENRVYSSGGTPSSESRMHFSIYTNRKDAKIILHFHDEQLLSKAFKSECGPFFYGSWELADEIGKLSKKEDIIKIKEHGFVVIARDEEELIKKMEELIKVTGSVTSPTCPTDKGHLFGTKPKSLSQIVDAASSGVSNPQFVNEK